MTGPKKIKQEQRRLELPTGPVEYTLIWKAVKSINLRVSRQGEVSVSLPSGLPAARADAFVREKANWLARVWLKQKQQAESQEGNLESGEAWNGLTAKERKARAQACLPLFEEVCRRWLPYFQPWQVPMPQIRVRLMKSRWGSCHHKKGIITLNTMLAQVPLACLEYVVVHELAHFVVPNHSQSFHEVMAKVMPDYGLRRKLLTDTKIPSIM